MKKLNNTEDIISAIQSNFSKNTNMRVFPQRVSAKSVSKTASRKVEASIDKEAIDTETGFDKTASIDKTASFEMGNVNTLFYSPRLTPDTWYLPRSRKMLLKWVDIFFDWDPYIYSILMMHSRYPIGNFNLICDEKEEQFFNEVLHNEQWDILDVLREGSISFTKFGEAICIGSWDSEHGVWEGFSWVDPGLIEVKEVPFTGKVKLFLEIPSKYIRAVKGKSKADEIERKLMPQYIVEAVEKGLKYIELDNEEGIDEETGKYSPPKVCMMVNKTNVGEKGLRGLPPMTPAIKSLVYSDYLRKAQMARAQRFAYPVEIWKFGDIQNGYIPNDEELSSVREMLQKALTNPPYTIVYTPLLSLEVVSPAGGLLPIYDDYNFVENQILVALGTNKNIVLGEGGWMSNAKTLSMQRLIMDYQIVRDMWTRTFLQNFVLRPMCIANGFTKKSLIDKTKDIANVPKVAWVNSLDVQNEEDTKKLYIDLWKDGLISSKTLYSQFPDLDFRTEVTQMQEEKGTVLDGAGRTLPATVTKIENEEKETEVKTEADEVNEKPIKPVKMDV